MTNLLPLSPVELDPRNQGQIVEAAAQQIFTASGGLINNFSAGSPALCLLEGQAFTNAEFLYWLNKLPNAFLATWLQHYCGIQRKTESFATVNLVFTLTQPLARNFVIFQGYRVRVPNFINENSLSFITTSELVINAGSTTGTVQALCEVSGTVGNVAANTIVQPESNLAFLQSVTNPIAAGGGLDRETESETVSRAFFHTLSYRNPVTESDWIGIIKARTGLDTQVIVKPDRESFIYYFYLLKNNPLSPTQLSNIRSFLKQKMILGYDVVVDNFRDQYIDVYLEVSDPNNTITGAEILSFLTQDVFLTNFRFNFSDDVQGLDIASFFAEVFSYLSPNLDKIEVYSTYIDTAIAPSLTTNQTTKYSTGDLIWNGTNYYEVLQPFNSIGATFLDFVSDPTLQTDFYLATNGFSIGTYKGGQIVLDAGNYYQVPNSGYYTSVSQLNPLTIGVYTGGNDLLAGRVYVHSAISPLYCYVPRVNIPTQLNLTTLSNCQTALVIGSTPVNIPVGVPSVSSGYIQDNNGVIYFNTIPARIYNVSTLGEGHRYKSRYRAGSIVLENNQYKYIYKDHTPNPNLDQQAIYFIPTNPVVNPLVNLLESGVSDGVSTSYVTNISNSDDTLLLDREITGYYTRENTYYKPEDKVSKEGIEYSYRLRRAVVNLNGFITQSLFGIPLLINDYVDYKNRK